MPPPTTWPLDDVVSEYHGMSGLWLRTVMTPEPLTPVKRLGLTLPPTTPNVRVAPRTKTASTQALVVLCTDVTVADDGVPMYCLAAVV